MGKKLLFVGAGAIGSYLGSFLSRAGHDVTLVDPWAEQVDTINRQGISVTGPHDPFVAHPRAVHLNDAARLPRAFDIGFVAMKVFDTAWAAQVALRHVKPEGFLVASENCWPDPIVASVAGAGRSVGLIMSRIGVALWKPGQVERGMERGRGSSGTPHVVFRPGEHDGRMTPRLKELAEMLSVIDGAQPTDNLWGERWSKLCMNAMGNPVTGMSGLGSLDVAGSEVGRAISIHLAAESARVGLALGYRIPKFNNAEAKQWADADQRETYVALDTMLTPTAGRKENWRASMAQDMAKGRPTEIDYMNGHVVAQGRTCGVATPVSEATVEMIHEIERGARKPAPENLGLTLKRAGI
ncbi:MAG TPA: ketopantoate reductase C-terminal domain-containing protein [Candidatus Methylomirabilis sp.]|nr:ketopantoate reductase C-terminal domain-containing protein [Candidatus Methylomirabilis sp.]